MKFAKSICQSNSIPKSILPSVVLLYLFVATGCLDANDARLTCNSGSSSTSLLPANSVKVQNGTIVGRDQYVEGKDPSTLSMTTGSGGYFSYGTKGKVLKET